MLSQHYYVVRSQGTGEYLVARPTADTTASFLLLFTSDYDALSYVNTHSAGSRCTVEGLPTTVLRTTLERWQLVGVGVVDDPLIPQIQFFQLGTGSAFL
jgi:hypothetical protein